MLVTFCVTQRVSTPIAGIQSVKYSSVRVTELFVIVFETSFVSLEHDMRLSSLESGGGGSRRSSSVHRVCSVRKSGRLTAEANRNHDRPSRDLTF